MSVFPAVAAAAKVLPKLILKQSVGGAAADQEEDEEDMDDDEIWDEDEEDGNMGIQTPPSDDSHDEDYANAPALPKLTLRVNKS